MKTKIPANHVLGMTEQWFHWLDEWTEKKYRLDVEKAMKRSWSNLWLGRSEKFAVWWLDTFHTGGLWEDYKDRLQNKYWRTTYQAKMANKMTKVALASGQEYVWIGEDDLLFMGKEYDS